MNRDYVCLKKEDFEEEHRERQKKDIKFTPSSLNFLLLLKLKQDQSTIEKKSKKFSDSFTLI